MRLNLDLKPTRSAPPQSLCLLTVLLLTAPNPRPLPPPGDPSSQGLVLSKLCQPRNDLQQRAVSLLIRRPSLWPPPVCLGIPLPHHLPDPPRFHLSCSCPPQHQLRHTSIALGPALRPSSPCGWLVSPPLETAYQGPHVICLQDLTDRSTSEITSYYQTRGLRAGVCPP